MIYPTATPTAVPLAPSTVLSVSQNSSIPVKSFAKGLSAAIALILTAAPLFLPPTAYADEDKAQSSGRSTGSRGCAVAMANPGSAAVPAESKVPALILLAPSQQRGKTVSTRPTFAWFVRDAAPLPLEFRIYEQTAAGYTLLQEVKNDSFRSVPGIMVLPKLNGLPELTPGKRYRWQVELVCDANRPSGNLFAEADVEVVPVSPKLQQQLSAMSPMGNARLNQAQVYAQANLWYDALASVMPSAQESDEVQTFRWSLLDQIAASPVEQKLLHQSLISPTLPLISVRK